VGNKVYEYATEFFTALDSAATTESVNGKTVRVFRGSIVEIYESLNVSRSYYSEVRHGLITSECITILQQGVRGSQSIVLLHRPPVEGSFNSAKDIALTRPDEAAILSQTVNDLRRLIGSVNIVDALVSIEQRFARLEDRITQIEHQIQIKGE